MKKYIKLAFLFLLFFAPYHIHAQAPAAGAKSEITQPVAIIMFTIMLLLIFFIIVLSDMVFTTYQMYKERIKKAATHTTVILIAVFSFLSPAYAQETAEVVNTSSGLIGGISQTSFYLMLTAIVLEMIIVIFLLRAFFLFSGLKKEKVVTAGAALQKKKNKFAWLEKLNNTKSVDAEAEARVNLGHDYDGIGELDNPTPPWWQWGFVFTVIFSVVYLYTHHVSHSSPNQIQELTIANALAEEQQKNFLANSANKIDENTVTYLADAADIAEGKSIFTAACAACHGADGGGIVGPNLTDEYWMHGGSIKNIFKTIKYGVPEKGMKSWKDDYSPKKLAQLASYIHSIKGAKVVTAKEPQGEKYVEEDAPAK